MYLERGHTDALKKLVLSHFLRKKNNTILKYMNLNAQIKIIKANATCSTGHMGHQWIYS